jgi:hypothetical protein
MPTLPALRRSTTLLLRPEGYRHDTLVVGCAASPHDFDNAFRREGYFVDRGVCLARSVQLGSFPSNVAVIMGSIMFKKDVK